MASKRREQPEPALKSGSSPRQNGWDLIYHVFDYDLDFFEVGVLDDARWQLPDGPARYAPRAAAARGGLLGNHGYEPACAMVYADADGEPLDGARRYELRFTKMVAVRRVLVGHHVRRPGRPPRGERDRSLLDRRSHPGTPVAHDGSLTITLQADEPRDHERRPNWLAAPAGAFRPILRVYEPDDAVFNGSYELPPIIRLALEPAPPGERLFIGDGVWRCCSARSRARDLPNGRWCATAAAGAEAATKAGALVHARACPP